MSALSYQPCTGRLVAIVIHLIRESISKGCAAGPEAYEA